MSHGLPAATVSRICRVLSRFPSVEKAVVYGSRAKGNYKTGSDIDLTLFGSGLTPADLAAIADALDELLLPYQIDLSLYHRIENPKLRDHIDRIGRVLCEYGHGPAVQRPAP